MTAEDEPSKAAKMNNTDSKEESEMKSLLAALGLVAATVPAHAGMFPVNVPEISALDGAAALAVVAAVVLLVWERRRSA